MPSADGYIKSTTDGRFTAAFIFDDIIFTFSGSFASSVPAFSCNTATLNFPDLKSISSTRSLEGRVGATKVTLNLDNGPNIEGMLDTPVFPVRTVSGSGVWKN